VLYPVVAELVEILEGMNADLISPHNAVTNEQRPHRRQGAL
jgi:hypothetical protein